VSRRTKDGEPARVTCRYHCTSCGEHFTSLVAFDHHRVGSFDAGDRHCEYPEDCVSAKGRTLLNLQSPDGWCRLARTGEDRHPVPIWEAA